jgi:hypothetical protein
VEDETWDETVTRLRAEIAELQARLHRLIYAGVRDGHVTPWYERHPLRSVIHGIE